jgi:hypothetical protein
MLDRISFATLTFAAALGATVSAAQAWDDTKYPDLKGQWVRGYPGGSRFDPWNPTARSMSISCRRRAAFGPAAPVSAGGSSTTRLFHSTCAPRLSGCISPTCGWGMGNGKT